jgi:hypothetical protein
VYAVGEITKIVLRGGRGCWQLQPLAAATSTDSVGVHAPKSMVPSSRRHHAAAAAALSVGCRFTWWPACPATVETMLTSSEAGVCLNAALRCEGRVIESATGLDLLLAGGPATNKQYTLPTPPPPPTTSSCPSMSTHYQHHTSELPTPH